MNTWSPLTPPLCESGPPDAAVSWNRPSRQGADARLELTEVRVVQEGGDFRLANIETNERKLLTVILAGQPEVTAVLNDPTLRQLKQRIALRCELRPLTLQETAGYLAGRIRAAGGVGAQVFTREAVTSFTSGRAACPAPSA